MRLFSGSHLPVYLGSLATTTQRTMGSILRTLDTLTVDMSGDIGAEWMAAYLVRVEGHYPDPGSYNLAVSAARGAIKALWATNGLDIDLRDRLLYVLRPKRFHRLPKGRAVPAEEMKTILDSATTRDRAAMACGFGMGFRRFEIATMQMDWLCEDSIGRYVTVLGKNNKQSRSPITHGVGRALDAWLSIRGNAPGSVFLAIDKHGNIRSRSLTPDAVSGMYAKYGMQSHSARRTYITNLLEADVDVFTVSKLARHDSLQVTMLYDRRSDGTRAEASALVDPLS